LAYSASLRLRHPSVRVGRRLPFLSPKKVVIFRKAQHQQGPVMMFRVPRVPQYYLLIFVYCVAHPQTFLLNGVRLWGSCRRWSSGLGNLGNRDRVWLGYLSFVFRTIQRIIHSWRDVRMVCSSQLDENILPYAALRYGIPNISCTLAPDSNRTKMETLTEFCIAKTMFARQIVTHQDSRSYTTLRGIVISNSASHISRLTRENLRVKQWQRTIIASLSRLLSTFCPHKHPNFPPRVSISSILMSSTDQGHLVYDIIFAGGMMLSNSTFKLQSCWRPI